MSHFNWKTLLLLSLLAWPLGAHADEESKKKDAKGEERLSIQEDPDYPDLVTAYLQGSF